MTARAQSALDKTEQDQVEVLVSKENASHVQSVEHKAYQDTSKGSLPSRVQSAADKVAAAEAAAKSEAPEETAPIDVEQAAHLTSVEAKTGGDTGKDSLAARDQSATDKCEAAGKKVAQLPVTQEDTAHIK